jgi:hypothetical protein
MYSHYFTENLNWDEENNKFVPNGTFKVDLGLSFIWLSANVRIHSNHDDDILKCFISYENKINIIKEMVTKVNDHLHNGEGPIIIRNFLNDINDNDGFGATLFITADPSAPHNYCVFEISSCYKKWRHGLDVAPMKKYLGSLINFLKLVDEDLVIIKAKITEYLKLKEVKDAQ